MGQSESEMATSYMVQTTVQLFKFFIKLSFVKFTVCLSLNQFIQTFYEGGVSRLYESSLRVKGSIVWNSAGSLHPRRPRYLIGT